MADEKKGITVKIDADLHAEVKAYVESQGLTMAEFVSKALDDELHPKMNMNGGTTMEKMRTMAFQVPEDLFQKIKDYLNRNHMTQKDFVLGLITKEIDRDLAARQEAAECAVIAEEQDTEEVSISNLGNYDAFVRLYLQSIFDVTYPDSVRNIALTQAVETTPTGTISHEFVKRNDADTDWDSAPIEIGGATHLRVTCDPDFTAETGYSDQNTRNNIILYRLPSYAGR